MSDAKKCDRCGAYYEPYCPSIIIKKDIGLTTKTIDLCNVCHVSLESWLKAKGDRE